MRNLCCYSCNSSFLFSLLFAASLIFLPEFFLVVSPFSRSRSLLHVACIYSALDLPVQVRDAAMPEGSVDARPESGIHREYFSRINEQKVCLFFQITFMWFSMSLFDVHLILIHDLSEEHISRCFFSCVLFSFLYAKVAAGELPYVAAQYNPVISKLVRATPKYERNRAHICSFFVKGNCNRGDTCPYRHELPDPNQPEDLAKQNLKDRYYGVNDPVAKRMLNKVASHLHCLLFTLRPLNTLI